MQSKHVIAVLILLLFVPFVPFASSTSARVAPSCTSESATTFASQVPVDDGECVELSLGLLSPGDVYAMTILVIDDALDVLIFDESGLQPYLLGQSYRSAYQQIPSTEFANGSYEFHWKVPLSIAEKEWTIVVDNLAHDGDQGMGDQGGDLGRVSISITKLTDSQWTLYHDLLAIAPNNHLTLLEGDDLRLEEGTTVSVTAWSLEGFGDVYLQTESMNANYLAGQSNVALTGASLVGVDGTASFNWVVSSALANQPLKLLVDNSNDVDGQGDGSTNLKMTVRIELVPVMQASFGSENETVHLGVALNFDASSSPNSLQQISKYSWDFDASTDSDNDGSSINDEDGIGVLTSALWNTPGEKTVTLTVSGVLGLDRSQINITVLDVNNPVPRISGTSSSSATAISGGWRIEHNETVTLTCASSTDDHQVESCSWSLDGEPYSQQTTASFSWSTTGVHQVDLMVLDPSGNSDSTSVQIAVVDSTPPSLDPPLLQSLSNKAVEGETITFRVSASDEYDANSDLRFHWDLDPSEDKDGNGNLLDDSDYVGPTADVVFDSAGTKTVIVTVFDASNNSDSHTFSVIVSEAEKTEIDYALFAVVLFIGVVTMSIALLGYRRWQSTIALKLLTDRGLPKDEAVSYMRTVKQTQRLPLFANATQLAGLGGGADVTSQNEKEQASKQAEFESIYGTGQGPDTMPQAQPIFAPRPQLSEASNKAASEAAALFFDDESEGKKSLPQKNELDALSELQSTTVEPATKPTASGIELPQQLDLPDPVPSLKESEETPAEVTENVNLLKGTCSKCALQFQVPMPIGVQEAIVVCPSCSSEQLFQR